MKSKVRKRNIQLLLATMGVLIAVCAYYFVFTKYTEKAEAVEAQNMTLASEVKRLQALEENKETYIAETEKMKLFLAEFELQFPADIRPEDSVMLVKHMEDSNRTAVSSISFGAVTEVPYEGNQAVQTETATDATATDTTATGPVSTEVSAYPDSRLYDVPLSISLECTYNDFKGLVKYIYSQQERMSIKGVNIGYNVETGALSGNMTLDTYYLLGTDKLYTEPKIPSMGMGIDTIFGNVE